MNKIKTEPHYFETRHFGEIEMFSWELYVDGEFYTDSIQEGDGKDGYFDDSYEAQRCGEMWAEENGFKL